MKHFDENIGHFAYSKPSFPINGYDVKGSPDDMNLVNADFLKES